MQTIDYTPLLNRLRRIEGQVRGVAQMIENNRYRLDVMYQIRAVRSALGRVETHMLSEHTQEVIDELLKEVDEKGRKAKIDDLVKMFERLRS